MTKTKAPTKTPSPIESANTKAAVDKTAGNQTSVFLRAVMDMSWRLALVVLVPIIGGYELDQNHGTSPFLTILGFVLALAGMALVMWHMVKTVGKMPLPKQGSR